MTKLNVESVQELMSMPTNIRNLSVIAHVDHGKTTLTDSLVAACGIIRREQVGEACTMDTTKLEQAKGITIHSTGISLAMDLSDSPLVAANAELARLPTRRFLLNLVDSPGHVDFSTEVSAALRVTDGALVVVDVVEGPCVQTYTVMRQALAEGVVPVLCFNKLDRNILELEQDPEETYQSLVSILGRVNGVISAHIDAVEAAAAAGAADAAAVDDDDNDDDDNDDNDGDDDGAKNKRKESSASSASAALDKLFANDAAERLRELSPEHGNVCFTAAKQGWGFNLATFARMYAKRFNVSESRMMARLWGDNYYDAGARRWTTRNVGADGKPLRRAFVQFVLEPVSHVLRLARAAASDAAQRETLRTALSKVDVQLTRKELDDAADETGGSVSRFVKLAMQRWLPAHRAVTEVVVAHLPSPAAAQRHRVPLLYTGALDDATATAIRTCDARGPLCVFISKLVPMPGALGRFVAFGRVFSGTLRAGAKVRVMADGGGAGEAHVRGVQNLKVMMGRTQEPVSAVPAGNTVGVYGIEDVILKTATVTSDAASAPLRAMRLSVSPVVRVAVHTRRAADAVQLHTALRKLAKLDPLVVVTTEESGETVFAAAGELHADVCMQHLRDFVGDKIDVVAAQPSVCLRETVRGTATTHNNAPLLAKSRNKHNRVVFSVDALDDATTAAFEVGGRLADVGDVKQRARVLADDFAWDINAARKIWAFGPATSPANVLVDCCTGAQSNAAIRDSCVAGFQLAAASGPLCDEPMRGVRLNIVDTVVHADAAHRGTGQVLPMMRKAVSGGFLAARPALQEPVFAAEITVPRDASGAVYSLLNRRRGTVVDETLNASGLVVVRANLPVAESFGFVAELRGATAGKAFPQLSFDHWQPVPGALDDDASLVAKFVRDVRERKGLSPKLPTVDQFLDRL